MDNYKKAYEELYEAVYGENRKKYIDKNPVNFVSMRGCRYDKIEQGDVRFMLIGRATNGWGDTLPMDSASAFAEKAKCVFEQRDRYATEWRMKDTETNPYSLYNDEDGKECKYYLSGSPFWSYSKEIWCRLNGIEDRPDWYEEIVWNNIYKVAPEKKNPDDPGNPSEWLINVQGQACVNILREELRLLKPSHVLMVVDKNWLGKSCKNAKFNFIDAYNSCKEVVGDFNEKYVHKVFVGGSTKVVVTCRPERKRKDEYVKAVLEAFQFLEKN